MDNYEDQASSTRPKRSFLPCNPQYLDNFDDWLIMYDTTKGEREIKNQSTRYLPKTLGQIKDTVYGEARYLAYKTRTVYIDYVSETIMGMYGLFWQKNPFIECSDFIQDWMDNANINGNSFLETYRDMVYNQIWKGRYGMLLDIPDRRPGFDIPQIVSYTAESIVNWGMTKYKGKYIVNFILLDESSFDTDAKTLNYTVKQKWRLCGLKTIDNNGNPLPEPVYFTVSNESDYKDVDFSEFMNTGIENSDDEIYPSFRGKTLKYIPFVFVNVTNTKTDIQPPPLLNLANICLAIYRGDADYREALYKQGQATLFGKGIDNTESVPVGAGACITAPNKDADLKYVEISGAGLGSMRSAEEDLKETAIQMGISLLQKTSGDETGASVQKHITVRTSTLKAISTTAADAMKQIIKMVQDWTGKTDHFEITPSQDFSTASENSDGFLKMWQAFKEGALTPEDYYNWQKDNEYTAKNFEDWWKELKEWFLFVKNMENVETNKTQENTETI